MSDGRVIKRQDFAKTFSFSTFENSEIDFGISLKQIVLINYQDFLSYATFL